MKEIEPKRKMRVSGSALPLLLACFFVLFSVGAARAADASAFQQEESGKLRLRGVIANKADPPVPLAGATVIVKGTQVGTISDSEGFFSIEAEKGQVLVVSYMGYATAEFTARRNEAALFITLEEIQTTMEEVVVVGMSSQQRAHIASSVGTINSSNFEAKPITRLSQALQGGTTGIFVNQTSGLPGGDDVKIKIRGVATLLPSDPLVLVDGLEFDMDKLDPATIESVSVLKDAAAAAMYGSRAANGVILVTTKRGVAGKPVVTYSGYYGLQVPVYRPDYVDASTYMEMVNNAQRNVGGAIPYTQEAIDITREGSDPVNYPNTNWADLIMRKTTPITEHSISASGGNSIARFAISAQYLNQEALIKHDKAGFQRITVRSNTSVNLTRKFMVLMDFFMSREDQKQSGVATSSILSWMNQANPTIVGRYPAREGDKLPIYGIYSDSWNPLMNLEQGGYQQALKDEMSVNFRPQWFITKDLTFKGQIGYRLSTQASVQNRETFEILDYNTGNVTSYLVSLKSSGVSRRTAYYVMMGELHYDKALGKGHHLSGVVGASQELDNQVTGSWTDKALRSVYGKVYYRYKDRYMFEAGIRGDGSSIFGNKHKWGAFPSVAVGWNLEKEPFMQSVGFLDQFKIRASYGLLGNNNIDPWQYQSIINSSGTETTNANPDITWEKARTLNVGADISFFGQKVDITFDWFHKTVTDLIIEAQSTMSSGLLTSPFNAGKADVKGFEVGLGFNHDFSQNMNMSITLGYSYNKSRWISMIEDEIIKGNDIHEPKHAIVEYYGYRTAGLLTQDDIDNRVPIWGGYDAGMPVGQKVGDIKFLDVNDDGQISDADRVPLGAKDPYSTFYMNFSYRWKNIDFEALLTGVAGVSVFYTDKVATPLNVAVDGGTPQKWHLDYWTPENPNARFPRLTPTPGQNSLLSDYWRENGAYVRVKYMQVGYTFSGLAKKMRIDNLRLYFNMQNPFTITKLMMIDPETKGNQNTHPIFKVYSIGLGVKF